MPKKNITTLLIVGVTLVVVSISLVLAVLLRTPEPVAPTAPKKTKAAARTYTKLIAFEKVAPSPTTTTNSANLLADSSNSAPSSTPTPTTSEQDDINIVITPVLTNPVTPTLIATLSSTLIPTTVKSLPASGIFGMSTGLLVLSLT